MDQIARFRYHDRIDPLDSGFRRTAAGPEGGEIVLADKKCRSKAHPLDVELFLQVPGLEPGQWGTPWRAEDGVAVVLPLGVSAWIELRMYLFGRDDGDVRRQGAVHPVDIGAHRQHLRRPEAGDHPQ